jgi:hypothetical protein
MAKIATNGNQQLTQIIKKAMTKNTGVSVRNSSKVLAKDTKNDSGIDIKNMTNFLQQQIS